MKFNRIDIIKAALLSTIALSFALQATPAFTTQELPNSGGKAVAVNGEWAFVGASEATIPQPGIDCRVYVYKFDYLTKLWGDGSGNAGSSYTVLGDVAGCGNSEFREFGRSVSVSHNLLLVGAPGANNGSGTADGRIYFYRYDAAQAAGPTGGWIQDVVVGLPKINVPPIQDDVQAGARFGDSVSVRYDPLTDTAILLSGAPAYDGPAIAPNTGVDTGKFYMYSWDGGTDTVTFISQVLGENDGDAFGSAVTSNGSSFLIGAPLLDTVALVDLGAAYVYSFTFPSFTLTQKIVADLPGATPITQGRIGTSVALSTDGIMLLGGGNGTLGGAYVLKLVGGTYVYDTQVNQTSGGDVSIDGETAAFGFNNFSSRLFFDKTNVSNNADLQINGPGFLDFARDISLSENRLLVNGDQQNKALAYYLPCGAAGVLKPFEWKMIGLSCLPTNFIFNNIQVIFSDDLGAYDINWVMYKQSDGTNFEGHQPDYVKMAPSEVMNQGQGYWIITDDVPVGGGAAVTSKHWNVDVLSDPVATPGVADSFAAAGIPDRDNIAVIFEFDLKAVLAAKTTPTSDIKIMLSNPFPTAITWGDSGFEDVTGGTAEYSLVGSSALTLLGWWEAGDNSAYVYDAAGNGGLGGYISVTPSTPGFTRQILPNEGFYIRLGAIADSVIVGATSFKLATSLIK